VAAVASFVDARARGGKWLVRIEDLDTPRNAPGAVETILGQLEALGMVWDDDIVFQSRRLHLYQSAFDALLSLNCLYPCGCTRREIADSAVQEAAMRTDGERPYPGTCRLGLPAGRQALSWRVRVPEGVYRFEDRWQGWKEQDVARAVGDFVVRRADGIWAYQLAVVVDDAAQQITDIVRGEDLLTSTARQNMLREILGYAQPTVLHVPLVMDRAGQKLSKQNGAKALDLSRPLEVLQQAWVDLGFERIAVTNIETFWSTATSVWAQGQSRANLHGTHQRPYDPR
jgi:glutamyl-Q tRNA(Asp) synthetase